MEKGKLYLITIGEPDKVYHDMVVLYTGRVVMDHRPFHTYDIAAHRTKLGINIIKNDNGEYTYHKYLPINNIRSCEPVDILDLPLYIGWNLSPVFDGLLKGEVHYVI